MAVKVDYKRELGELYAPGRDPAIVAVPEFDYLMIDGHGDPNTAVEFAEAVEVLYAVAYAAKFAVKLGPSAIDYPVMPLEGLWWPGDGATFTADRSAWLWTLMIMQPDPVTAEVVEQACAKAAKKRRPGAVARVRLERFGDGLAAQVLHVGPYATEEATIRRLHAFLASQGYRLAGKHHEIYLGDPRRSAPEKLRTIVRQPVALAH